jgi:hypothetical protein
MMLIGLVLGVLMGVVVLGNLWALGLIVGLGL